MLQALCVVHSAPLNGHITSVSALKVGAGVELVVKGAGLQKPRVFPFLGGKMRIVEFDAGLAAGYGGKANVQFGGVRSYSTFWFSSKPPKVRINVRLDKSTEPILTESPEGWRLGFNVPPSAVQALVVKKDSEAEAFPTTLPPIDKPKPTVPDPVATASAEPKTVATEAIKTAPPEPRKTVASQPAKSANETKPLSNYAPPVVEQVSIDFVNTDIVQVLKAIAIQANVNIVTSPDVKGTVTVSLRGVGIDESLRIVTSLAGLGYARVGATFVVAPSDKIDGIRRSINGEAPVTNEQPVKKDVMVSYNVKGGLATDLMNAVSDKGKAGDLTLTATPNTSLATQTIVIRGPKEQADQLVLVLQQLDNAEQTNVQTEIYDVKFIDPRALREELISAFPGLRASIAPGSAGNVRLYNTDQQKQQARESMDGRAGQGGANNGAGGAGAGGGAAAGGGSVQGSQLQTGEDVRTNRESRGLTQPFQDFEGVAVPMKLVLRGSPELIRAAKDYMGRIDVQPKQIAIEMRVMELSKEDALRVGLDWSILNAGGLVTAFGVNQGLGAGSTTGGTVSLEDRRGSTILGTLDKIATNRTLIARPNLLALDGRETEVFIGDVIRYVQSINRNAVTGELTVTTGEERVGVRLAVLARAGGDENITLDLRPIVSSLSGFLNVAGGGQIPQVSERVTQSTAVIKSGETLAMGGLIKDEDRKLSGGVPILKDLPIIGQLFRRTDNSKQRTEVVFFLTAKVVDNTTRADAARPRGN